MIIDTHCHLVDEAFRDDVDDTVRRAIDAGVGQMVVACCDEGEFGAISSLCARYPGVLYPALGLHPENLLADYDASLDKLEALLDSHPEVIAIGEVGLDRHWDASRLDDQQKALDRQVRWALDRDLPLLLHIRDAMNQFLALLPTYNKYARERGRTLRGILHCYSGSAEQAQQALAWGDFLFGIGGTLTYRNSRVAGIAARIGLGRLVLETDAPYLAPVPHRGHRNEPAYTADTARCLAQALGTTLADVEQTTTANARRMLAI